jgi:hypothetical protein
MSASQSNLSLSQYGYDYVVATTQASINSTMKEFLAGLTEPLITVCYVATPTGVREIDYGQLLELTHGSDPFSVPPDGGGRRPGQ